LLPRRTALNHPKRAEHAHGVVDGFVLEATKFHQIRLQTIDVETFDVCLLLHDPQHMRRQIDRQPARSTATERHQRPAGAAAEIGHQARRIEVRC